MLNNEWLKQRCGNLATNKTVWIAYSGGVDSHVLLHLASRLFSNLHAVHIHHGLSPNADMWAEHCKNVCAKLNVKLTCIKVNAKPKPNQSPEDAARIARRNAWMDLLEANDLLLVAQHAEDQAETILYRLMRGTGPHGLGGMLAESKIGSAILFRPLLNTSKRDIINYAQENNLHWINDESNLNTHYDRNYIRNQIMPMLKSRWPHATENINRAGKLSAQVCNGLEPIVQSKLELVYDRATNSLNLEVMQKFESFWQKEILRAWLLINDLKPSYKHIELILQQVIMARVDANPEFVLANKVLRRSKQELYCLDVEHNPITNNYTQHWDLASELILPNGAVLTKENINMPNSIAQKLQQQIVNVRIGTHGKKAKKIFQQYAIPTWRRSEFPLIFLDARLIGIAGLWWSSRFENGE